MKTTPLQKYMIFLVAVVYVGLSSNTYASLQKPPRKLPVATLSTYTITTDAHIIPTNEHANRKIVLLTIDDGPSKKSTEIMSILDKHHAKAIFFVNGMHDQNNPGIIEKEFKAGFPIGNHTWSHPNLRKLRNQQIQKEIDQNTALITLRTGSAPHFFRPPYGVGTDFVREYVKKNHMIYMNWSGSALDWEKSAHNEVVFQRNVMRGLQPGDIILLHEHPWTVQYLDNLLTVIEKAGYSFADPNAIVE